MQHQQEITLEEIFAVVAEGTRQYEEAKKLKRSQLIETVEQVTEPVHEFNQIPTKYRPVSELDDLSRKLLFFLEARSFDLHGDTKINDSRLCDYFKVSRSSIQRRLAKLKDLGFINTIKKNFRDYSRLDKPKHTEFFSDRVIRCNRIVVQKRFKVLSKPGWKYDPRPKWNPNGIVERGTGRYIDRSWLLPAGQCVVDLGKPTIYPKWDDISQLFAAGIASPETYELYQRMNNLRYHNRPEGLFVLGYEKFRKEDI